MYDSSESDDGDVQDLMDIEFPSFDESRAENDTDESVVSVPVVDIRSGWDNNAVDRCLNLALESYNGMGEYEDFEPRVNTKFASDGKSLMNIDCGKIVARESINLHEHVHVESQHTNESDSRITTESIFESWIPKSL